MIEEEEIDLIEYLSIIWKYKFFILLLILSATFTTIFISYTLPPRFQSAATIFVRSKEEMPLELPLGEFISMKLPYALSIGEAYSLEKLKTILESRELAKKVCEKENLLPVLFSRYWDDKQKTWKINEPPSYIDAWEVFKKRLKVQIKKGNAMGISFEAENPYIAKKILETCLIVLSEMERESIINESLQNQRFLNEQIKRTADALLREKLYHLLAAEIERETIARAQRYYGFKVLDPPSLSKKPIFPKRFLMGCISFFVSAFFGIFLAFFFEFLSKRKAEKKI